MSEIAHVDCGFLAVNQSFIEQVWVDPIENVNMVASAESARAVLENQQVKVGPLLDKNKKLTLSVEWETACDLAVEACSDDCIIDGEDTSPVCKEYDVTCLGEVPFKVFDRVYRERTIDQQVSIAKSMLTSMKVLDEYIAQFVLTGIEANAGTNLYTGAPGTVVGPLTTISALDWNDNIWWYLAMVNRINKFTSPYGITGVNLFGLIYNRLAEQANADGKGNVNKMGLLQNRMYLDPENVEVIAAHHTFLLHKTAVAFVNKAWYPLGGANAVQLTADRMAYSIASKNLPGITYDVFTERGCTNNDYYTAFKLQLHGAFLLNPTPCTETQTGILDFACA
jgi:hypothetical protein